MGDFFSTGREMTHPYTSGIFFGQLSYEKLQSMTAQLSEEEKQAPSARYFQEPMASLTPDHEAAIAAGPLGPKECYMPQESGAVLLNPAFDAAENGYGVLPNGVGYAAIKVVQEGITDEMIRKYREEFAHDGPRTLFYKLWFPGMHLLHYENGVAENFGWGMLNLEMEAENFSFRHLGITREEIRTQDPDCICLLGLYGRGWEIAHPEKSPAYTCMVQHTRQTAAGRELRVRFWNGILFSPDGSLEFHPNPDRDQTVQQMKHMMEHCMREYSNELKLMREFWNHG